MKIQLASDLHIEHLERRFPRQGKVLPDPRADVLVLAGVSRGNPWQRQGRSLRWLP